ncbi:MAG: hypothetical protein OXN89_08325 [Bryobacterales bacterium]|nr:hypothetical protein [Bryobacterales bacterium]
MPRGSKQCSIGPHVRTLAFDIGIQDLDAESALGLDLNLRHGSDCVRGELNSFVYNLGNLISEDLPVFNILRADSRFVGFNGQGRVRPSGSLGRYSARWASMRG